MRAASCANANAHAGLSRRSFATSSALVALAIGAASFSWAAFSTEAASAESPCGCGSVATAPRPQDQIWLISTREAGCPDTRPIAAEPNLPVSIYSQNAWQPSDMAAFLSADDGRTRTVFYVHGNQTSAAEAKEYGLRLYRSLIGVSTDERPVRFVIWSWPSDRIGGALEDVRIKAGYSDTTGYFLATVFERLQPNTPTTLIGFSFGARSVTGALHLAAGGNVAGRVLPRTSTHAPANVVLMAAAEDSDWLFPGHRNGLALSQTESLLNVYNGCDKILKRYHWLYGRKCCAEALGYVGLASGYLPVDQRAKIAQLNACCAVGSEHNSLSYIYAPSVMAAARPYVFPAK